MLSRSPRGTGGCVLLEESAKHARGLGGKAGAQDGTESGRAQPTPHAAKSLAGLSLFLQLASLFLLPFYSLSRKHVIFRGNATSVFIINQISPAKKHGRRIVGHYDLGAFPGMALLGQIREEVEVSFASRFSLDWCWRGDLWGRRCQICTCPSPPPACYSAESRGWRSQTARAKTWPYQLLPAHVAPTLFASLS